jgi:DNA-binding response OmpR family regulator
MEYGGKSQERSMTSTPELNASKTTASEAVRVRVLVVEDAPEFLDFIVDSLRAEGFEIEAARDGESAVEIAHRFDPDVVVLDLGLPTIDGFEVCRRIREFSQAYVVILTGRNDEVDKIVGLTVGADDYMTKPFSTRELVARLRAMLRRPRAVPTAGEVRRMGELVIDVEARIVSVQGREVGLTRIEFDLLNTLSAHPKVVFTRAKLLEIVWGAGWFGDDHTVDVHISSLRHKLGDASAAPGSIRTVRGVGYRFDGGS